MLLNNVYLLPVSFVVQYIQHPDFHISTPKKASTAMYQTAYKDTKKMELRKIIVKTALATDFFFGWRGLWEGESYKTGQRGLRGSERGETAEMPRWCDGLVEINLFVSHKFPTFVGT